MTPSGFVAIKSVGTLALAVATEQFALHNYWTGIFSGVLGVLCFTVYEIVPQKEV